MRGRTRWGALALLASLPGALSSYGPRAGPGTTVVWPSGLPPSQPSHDIQPFVTGITAWNGNTYSVGLPPFNYSLMPCSGNSCVGGGQTQEQALGCRSAAPRTRLTDVCCPTPRAASLLPRSVFDTLYIFVTFSEAVVVNGTPTLTLATGAHFEWGASNINATFLAGGATATKGFWLNDAPNPLRSGQAQACRADGVRYADVNKTRAVLDNFTLWTYAQDRPYNQTRTSNVSLCVPGAPAEVRAEMSMATQLAFAFDVHSSHRTASLDVTGTGALSAGAGTIMSKAHSTIAADLRLPTPGNPLTPWLPGGVGSLSANSNLVIGPPYVTNVTSDTAPGVYSNGQTVDVLVYFSEAISVTCGATNTAWAQATVSPVAGAAHDPTVFSKCSTMTLALVTAPTGAVASATNGTANLVADTLPQFDGSKVASPYVTTTGPFDPPNVLRFRYIVKAFDTTCPTAYGCSPLQYSGQGALTLGTNNMLQRVTDGNSVVGHSLPPTRFDSGAVDHALSLGAERRLLIMTRNGQ